MACIIKKIKKGNPYYYAVESARVNGKPRIVWQKYLGTLDHIIQKCTSSTGNVSEVDIFSAGGVAAMLRVAQKLSLIDIIDKEIPKRDQGASVGQYIVLAALNRILDPCSKLQMPDWYQKTVLYRLWKHPPATFTSQMFWNHMDLITEDNIKNIQEAIIKRLIDDFQVNPRALLYDTTNFFTYVATGNKRNTIARRGKNKAKRDDLRQVGLALLVSKDFQIPLFHKVYQGNKPDRGLFPEIANELVDWQDKHLGHSDETTLVFDKGNISEDGIGPLIIGGKHYLCAVPKTTDPELYSTNVQDMKNVQGIPGTRAYSTFIEIWNKKHKAVVSYSDSYFASGMADLMDKLRKAEQKLHDLELWLAHGPQRPHDIRFFSKINIKKRIDNIMSSTRVREAIDVNIKKANGKWHLEYRINQSKLDELMKTDLGRTLIITSRLDWNEQEIISAYRSQQGIENVFRHMKHKDYLHWQPEFHWTDDKIKVHGLYCVLAMLLASLAHRAILQKGLDISIIEMLDELNEIREVALIHQKSTKRSQKNQLVLSKLNPKQKRLTEILEIPTVLAG
jgi:transposase